jgi:hypothetical protein
VWIPPIGVRRIFFDPIVFVIAVVIIVVSPVFFLSAFVVDLVSPGRWKFVRSTRFMVVLSLCEVVGPIAALADLADLRVRPDDASSKIRRSQLRVPLRWLIHVGSSEIQKTLGLRLSES